MKSGPKKEISPVKLTGPKKEISPVKLTGPKNRLKTHLTYQLTKSKVLQKFLVFTSKKSQITHIKNFEDYSIFKILLFNILHFMSKSFQ